MFHYKKDFVEIVNFLLLQIHHANNNIFIKTSIHTDRYGYKYGSRIIHITE